MKKRGVMMATEVFLIWDGMRDHDKTAQLDCGTLSGGHLGYLKATLFMDEENFVLKAIFGPKYWDCQPTPYDFTTHQEEAVKLAEQYIKDGIVINISNRKVVLDTIQQIAEDNEALVTQNRVNPEMKKVWAQSFRDFMRLGAEKQEQGREPKVYISW